MCGGPSGQELAACSAEDFKDAAALKEHICKLCGFPVYLQQLLQDGNVLGDCAKIDAPMDLQLVLLTIPSISSNGNTISLSAEADLVDAARRNRDKMVRCLLAAGVEKDIRDVDGMTALMIASEAGYLDIARLLLEAGAEKECSDDFGWTALMLASHYGHLEIARLLLQADADKDRQPHVETALLLACESGHAEVARLLLQAGADSNCRGPVGKTPLMLASESGHAEVARLLLEAGSRTDCWDIVNRQTALALASVRGHVDVARLLREAGAAKNSADDDNKTGM